MGLLFIGLWSSDLARTREKKNKQTGRQLVHCRVVVNTRRNRHISALIPYYVAARRKLPAITRTISQWSTGGKKTRENQRQ